MKQRQLQVIICTCIWLSSWIASLAFGIIPPPILNAKLTDDIGTYYFGSYDPQSDDCDYNMWWQDPWFYYEGDCGPYIPCEGGEQCGSYGAFGAWYYQDCLMDEDGDFIPDFKMEDAPLYLDEWYASYGDPPSVLDIEAKLEPYEGLDALRYIPVEVSKAARTPIAAARYGINFTVDDTQPPGTWDDVAGGAMFWITAVYDSSVFDVRMNFWGYLFLDPRVVYPTIGMYSAMNQVLPSAALGTNLYEWLMIWGWCGYNRAVVLPSGRPFMFVDEVPIRRAACWELRRPVLPLTPDFIVIRLKDGHRLEDLGGRKVELTLHTLSWAGDRFWCSPSGDAFHYSCTSRVLVGADLDENTSDWSTQPTALQDVCIPPSFSKVDDKSAEADVIGAKVVKDTTADLPSMRVGLNRFKVGRTAASTLGNDFIWYPFGPPTSSGYAGGFTVINLYGVRCCVGDLPSWTIDWYSDVERNVLGAHVVDPDTQLEYLYETIDNDGNGGVDSRDYHYWPAKLVEVGTSELTQLKRSYEYQDDDITQPLLSQSDYPSGNHIDYVYDTVDYGDGDQLQLTVSGSPADDSDQRSLTMIFWPHPTIGEDLGSCPLVSCGRGSGNSWRQYEWYPPSTPPTAYDGKLMAVKDASDNVLAGFTYDEKGRLIARTRGSSAQTVAEYIYHDPPRQPDQYLPPENYTMDARFYVDDDGTRNKYQLVRRTFNPQGQVLQVEEFHDLQQGETASGATSVTTFDYCEVPQDPAPTANNLFYQNAYGYGWIGRCLIKTLPANQAGCHLAEYTQYDAEQGWNIMQTFLAPPPTTGVSGEKLEPAEADRCNWIATSIYNSYGSVWMPYDRIDKNRSTNAPKNDVRTDYSYLRGHVSWQRDSYATGIDGQYTLWPQQWWHYQEQSGGGGYCDFRKVTGHAQLRDDGSVTVSGYDYDDYDNLVHQCLGYAPDTGTPGTALLDWYFDYNAFGQRTLETDPDNFCHQTDYNSDGLICGTCVFDPFDLSGYVTQQTTYEYQNGMVWKVHVANCPGPFAYGEVPSIDTTYTYDVYGRLIGKDVAGNSTTYAYDRQDRLVKVTWPDNRWKQITRDGRGQISQIQYGKGTTILTSTYEYDDAGNLVTRTAQGCPTCGKRTEYQYDAYNRRITEIRKEAAQ